jgi:DNA gyrase subunit B
LREAGLDQLARDFIAGMNVVQRLSRRYDEQTLEQLIYMPTVTVDEVRTAQSWLAELESRLNADRGPSDRFALSLVEQTDLHPAAVRIERRTHGITTERFLPLEFFNGAEYQRLRALGEQLDGLLSEDATVRRGEKEKPVSSFREALDWLMDEARRGQHFQRYKGLGEMNPEQLWETTMDPENRRLLRVNIEDAVGSDQIFTTLMGDQVEPRREFIETNALTVENLDI